MNDNLYPLYLKAYNHRYDKQGLALADSLRKQAIKANDQNGELAAMCIPVHYYFYQKDQYDTFDEKLNDMAEKARKYQKQNFYYFCVSNKIAYYNNQRRFIEALQYAHEQLNYAKKHEHHMGTTLCIRMIGVIHERRCEYVMAIQRFRESIEYSTKNAPKLEVAPTYCSICSCYRLMGDYENMLATAREAKKHLEIASEKAKLEIALDECYALFLLRRDREFREVYDSLKVNHPEMLSDKSVMSRVIRIVRDISDGQYGKALQAIDSIGLKYGFERNVLYSRCKAAQGNYDEAEKYLLRLFHIRENQKVDCHKADEQSMERIYGNMKLQNQRQQVEYENNRLQLANKQMLLQNSNIEIGQTHGATELARMNAERNRLFLHSQQVRARQLQDSIATQQFVRQTQEQRQKLQQSVFTIILIVVALIMMMTVVHLIYSRRTTKNLNISNRKLQESIAKLNHAKDRAQQAERMKTQFIQNMSHEIRTPLNAISGFSQVLVEMGNELSAKERRDADRLIEENAMLLTTLVDDVLDLASLETGNYIIKMTEAEVNTLCRETIDTVRHRKAEGVELNFTTDLDDHYIVVTDARRVRQVLINMLTNAEKNTTQGHITLHCSCNDNPGMVTFTVTDTGIGVPKEQMEAIFQRFNKLDVHKQGTGLGLDICRTIAHKLGGEIDIDRNYTGGARFWFTIPATL